MTSRIDNVADAEPVLPQHRKSWRDKNRPGKVVRPRVRSRGWEILGSILTFFSSLIVRPMTWAINLLALSLRGLSKAMGEFPRVSALAIASIAFMLIFVPQVGKSVAGGFYAAGKHITYLSEIPHHIRDAYLAHQCAQPGAICQVRMVTSVTPENLTDCPSSTRARASQINDIGMRRYLAREVSDTHIEFVCNFIAKAQVDVDPLDPIMIFVRESDGGLNPGNIKLVDAKKIDERQRMFLPLVAHFARMDVSLLRGTEGGAMGVMQFKPETWLAACVAGICDGNGDGRMDPNTWQDAFAATISHIQHYKARGFSEDQVRKMYLTGNPNSNAPGLRLVDSVG